MEEKCRLRKEEKMEFYFCRGSKRKKNDRLIVINNILFQNVGTPVFRCNDKVELLHEKLLAGFKKKIRTWKKM